MKYPCSAARSCQAKTRRRTSVGSIPMSTHSRMIPSGPIESACLCVCVCGHQTRIATEGNQRTNQRQGHDAGQKNKRKKGGWKHVDRGLLVEELQHLDTRCRHTEYTHILYIHIQYVDATYVRVHTSVEYVCAYKSRVCTPLYLYAHPIHFLSSCLFRKGCLASTV